MAAPTRFSKVGLQGRTSVPTNTQDTFIHTVEFPITVVASGAAQDTGIAAPKNIQAMSAYLKIRTAEATGGTKTVSVGLIGASAAFLSAEDVSVAGAVGTPVALVRDNPTNANFSYVLGSADFVELDATAVITFVGSEE